MKRILIGGAVAALLAGGAGASFAAPGGGGPSFNGNNDYGLCKAWTNHNDDKGKDNPKPFQNLTPPEGYDTVEEYCAEVLAGTGEPGNSEHGKGKKNG